MKPLVTAIVLAAGRGSRLGGPKALLKWPRSRQDLGPERWDELADDKLAPLGIVHAERRLELDCQRALIVTRAAVADKLTRWIHPHDDERLQLVRSAAPEEHKAAGSLAAAVAALGEDCHPESLFVVTPVDCPPAPTTIVTSLLQELKRRADALAARPRVGDRRGHPVVLRGALLMRYATPEPPPLRDLLQGHADQVADVEMDEPAALLNLNTTAQFSSYGGGSTPHFF